MRRDRIARSELRSGLNPARSQRGRSRRSRARCAARGPSEDEGFHSASSVASWSGRRLDRGCAGNIAGFRCISERPFHGKILALVGGHVAEFGRLTQLQRPDVGDYAPAIVWRDARSITGHRAEAIADYIEIMTDGGIDQALAVIRRRLAKSSLHHHTIAVAQPAVARRAVNVETALAAFDVRLRDRDRELIDVLA